MSRPSPILCLVLVVSPLLGCEPAGDGKAPPRNGGAGGDPPGIAGAGGAQSGTGGGGGTTPGAGGSGGSQTGGGGGAGASGSGGSPGTGGSPATDARGGGDRSSAPEAGQPDGGVNLEAGAPPSSAAVPSAACAGGATVPGPNGNQTIQATGKSRAFIIRMPGGYDGKRPFPVMFAFHGANGTAGGFETGAFAGVSRLAADKAIRIYPQGLGSGWSRDEQDDLLFMDALVEWLGTRVCYDTARVFATGQSSGAYFSHRMACDRGAVLRAVATNSGGERRERTLDCKTPVSAWLSTGTADNPGHVMGTRQARDVWIKLAGCAAEGTATTPPPCVAQTGCRPGYAVHYCQHTGGHGLPGYAAQGIHDFLFQSKIW